VEEPNPSVTTDFATPTRRGALSRFTLFAAGLFGAAAAGGVDPDEAAAQRVACCTLARQNGSCAGGGSSFRCPSGYHKRVWYCCHLGRLWGCGECAKGPTCHNGPWACSEAWGSQLAC
jgi:hypothetical protein